MAWMNSITKVIALGSCVLAMGACEVFAAPQGNANAALGSHYERPATNDGPFKDRAIVFVHGIFGNANGTWTSQEGAYWPKLLLHDPAFNDFDVYVASYDSPKLGNTLTATEVVEQLNNRLTADHLFERHREVVFVCHSLGGIIVEQLLLTFREYAQKTRFMYLFAVPEEGAQIAKLGSLFDSDPLLNAMFNGDENEYLLNQENQWRAAHFKVKRYCAYEKKRMKGAFLVVDRLSGTRNCSEPPVPINEDHMGIVKPNSVKHDSYIALRNAVVANPIAPLRKSAAAQPRKRASARELPIQPLITMQISPSQLPIYVPPHSVASVLRIHPYIGMTGPTTVSSRLPTIQGEKTAGRQERRLIARSQTATSPYTALK
jgi:pimeloyl-ACP methyl ester carboxylesterase